MNGTNLIVWDDKFSIGIPVIDNEHKHLVSLCNELYKAIMNESENKTGNLTNVTIRDSLKDCVDYVKEHFSHEENLMKLCNFDEEKFKAHKLAHIEFTKKVLVEIQNFDYRNFNTSYNFVRFLYDWILSHIAHLDRLYVNDLANYLKAHPAG